MSPISMERLLHYVWQHRLYPYASLRTTEGKAIEVIDPGIHNQDAGPDFLNATIKIGEEMWVGCVEIHSVSTDWFRHHHEQDAAYAGVVLHVVEQDKGPVTDLNGRVVPQTVVDVPEHVTLHYEELLREDRFPHCFRYVQKMPASLLENWMEHLMVERLDTKAERMDFWVDAFGGDWEQAFFVALARSFGFGVNGDVFEQWGMSIPLNLAGRHRDNLFQIEALFLGMAGLLEEDMIPSVYRADARQEGYFEKLRREYLFLAHKFSLKPLDGSRWRFLRMRPQNFPHIRLVQLARLYHENRVNVSRLTETLTLDDARNLFRTEATPYWETHYSFGATTEQSKKALGESSLDIIVINAFLPALYAYGRHRSRTEYCQQAIEMLKEIKVERNHVTRLWQGFGVNPTSAAQSQALLQLHNQYCQRRDCLRCMIGASYLKETKIHHVLREEDKDE